MAAPNIVNVTTITGKTAVANVLTSSGSVVSNSAGSNTVLKINNIIVANIDGTNSADITVSLTRSSVDYKIAHTVAVPADATLMLLTKDSSIYLEEGDSITALASAAGDLQIICSYEEIS